MRYLLILIIFTGFGAKAQPYKLIKADSFYNAVYILESIDLKTNKVFHTKAAAGWSGSWEPYQKQLDSTGRFPSKLIFKKDSIVTFRAAFDGLYCTINHFELRVMDSYD